MDERGLMVAAAVLITHDRDAGSGTAAGLGELGSELRLGAAAS